MGDVALSESDMKSMQAQKDYGESGSSSDWTDDENSDEFDVRSEVEASQHNLAESMKFTCGGYLKADKGNITSPFYPDEYPPRLQCDWKIAVSAGFSIVLTFSRFELLLEDDCPYNYLAIYDGPSDSSPLLRRLCGAQMPAPIKSSTNTMSSTTILAAYEDIQEGQLVVLFLLHRKLNVREDGVEMFLECQHLIPFDDDEGIIHIPAPELRFVMLEDQRL
nr:unnamed protein product [Spirometra erinaceieuropaei]